MPTKPMPYKRVKDGTVVEAELSVLRETFPEPEIRVPPEHWSQGALLNVRNTGADYCVTLFPEEYDRQHPERALRFTNTAECQSFVSRWYSRQSADPRAY